MLMNHLGSWEDASIQISCTTTSLGTTRHQKYQDDRSTAESDAGQTNNNVRDDQAKTGSKEHVRHEDEGQSRDKSKAQAGDKEQVGGEGQTRDKEQTRDETQAQAGDEDKVRDEGQPGGEDQNRGEDQARDEGQTQTRDKGRTRGEDQCKARHKSQAETRGEGQVRGKDTQTHPKPVSNTKATLDPKKPDTKDEEQARDEERTGTKDKARNEAKSRAKEKDQPGE